MEIKKILKELEKLNNINIVKKDKKFIYKDKDFKISIDKFGFKIYYKDQDLTKNCSIKFHKFNKPPEKISKNKIKINQCTITSNYINTLFYFIYDFYVIKNNKNNKYLYLKKEISKIDNELTSLKNIVDECCKFEKLLENVITDKKD